MAIRSVGVVGCGLMGSGIAQVCAEAGHPVVVREVSEDLLKKGLGRIESFLAKGVEKGKLTAERKAEVLGRLKGTTKLEDLRDCDIVVEAVVESLEAKREVFRALDAVAPERTVFASNTSSLSITEMAATTRRPGRFVGLHFFNPVPLMKLVEVVRSPLTAPDCVEEVVAFAKGLGKTPIRATDRSGFIVNRLLVPYLIDAVRVLESGIASREDIDYSIANIMFEEFKEPRFAPPPLLKRRVLAGNSGASRARGSTIISSQWSGGRNSAS